MQYIKHNTMLYSLSRKLHNRRCTTRGTNKGCNYTIISLHCPLCQRCEQHSRIALDMYAYTSDRAMAGSVGVLLFAKHQGRFQVLNPPSQRFPHNCILVNSTPILLREGTSFKVSGSKCWLTVH
ncbi:unnamed protein product [Ixodes persulcatus]